MNKKKQSIDLANTIFLSNEHYVRAIALNHSPYPGTLQDICQEVYLEFVSKAEQWDLSDPVRCKALLKIITVHVSDRIWHEHTKDLSGHLSELARRLKEQNDKNDEYFEYREEYQLMLFCIDRLPEKEKILLKRYYFENLSTGQIACEMKISEDLVRKKISRCRQELRDKIRQYRETQ